MLVFLLWSFYLASILLLFLDLLSYPQSVVVEEKSYTQVKGDWLVDVECVEI